jgi:fido (protein-threonine AMPylation protein)
MAAMMDDSVFVELNGARAYFFAGLLESKHLIEIHRQLFTSQI